MYFTAVELILLSVYDVEWFHLLCNNAFYFFILSFFLIHN